MDGTRRPEARPKKRKIIIVAIVIALVIVMIVILIGVMAMRRYENYLSGYWVGDPGFMERAELKDMQLFIAPKEDGSRQGYLIMTDIHGNFVSNQAIEIKEGSTVQRWWTGLKSSFATKKDIYSAKRVSIEYDDPSDSPMPTEMKMSVSILDGTLTLYDGEKVWAFLGKDTLTSAAAIEAYESP